MARTDDNSLHTMTEQAVALERHGSKGALLGTGWGGRTPSPSPREPPRSNRSSPSARAQRYARTRGFIRIVRRQWTQEDVSYTGEYFSASHSSLDTTAHSAAARVAVTAYRGEG